MSLFYIIPGITTNDFDNGTLISKNIGNVLILGCNSGHFDNRFTNIADRILVNNNVNSVIASDGTVKNRSIFGNYKSVGDSTFVSYLWSGKKYRNNYGFIKYTKNSIGELQWEILGNKVEVSSLI